MSRILHLVRRRGDKPEPTARELSASESDAEVRVVELFDPEPGAEVVDLTLAPRDLPEVTAALHWADEVHLHGGHPRLALPCLPYVRKEALEDTPLHVHGEVEEPTRQITVQPERLTQWPGPVVTNEDVAPDAMRHDLLPRSCGSRPLRLDNGHLIAVVAVDPGLGLPDRAALERMLRALASAELTVEMHVEPDNLDERATLRRACQAYVTTTPTGRAAAEAKHQGLPVLAFGDPDGAAETLRGWAARWRRDKPAPPI